jgi:S-adenosylmethionine:tRNA ribosyltransferase-isomerase
MRLSEFDYHLPDELIAQAPLEDRAGSRMLVLHRDSGRIEDRCFRDLPEYVGAGDCLALNNTRVFAARLFGRKPGYDRQVEIFLLKPASPGGMKWHALARPGRHLHAGARVDFSERLWCVILESGIRGERVVEFTCTGDFGAELEAAGHVPLPPYIHRQDEAADRERYQTVYAEKRGSVAAPTAGLHFTPEVLDACQQRGASVAKVTLHVGLGTFQPLTHEEVSINKLHAESYEICGVNAERLQQARRIVAVGTTTVRTIESAAQNGGLTRQTGETQLFIHPGFEFKATGALLTNFHLPKSSLLLLVSAFAGPDKVMNAYHYAVDQRYRFFSYGDCMLIV